MAAPLPPTQRKVWFVFIEKRRVGAVALAATALVLALSSPAGADAAAPSPAPTAADHMATVWDPDGGQTMSATETDAQAVLEDYWTAERMAAAEPVPSAVGETGLDDELAPLATGETRNLSEPYRPADPGTMDEAHFSYTNGKVFFHDPSDGLDYVCSGGAVNSGSKRMVVTAGHCVNTGDGSDTWMQNWIFVPGYQNGDEPRGRFAAYWFDSSTGWTQDGSRTRDFAFVTTYDSGSGQLLVDAVGGHGLTVNPGHPYVHIAGYPGNHDNGQVQWNCWGTTTSWSSSDNGQKLNCDFGGGSSGGPWLRDFGEDGLGYVVSDMHGIATDGSGDNYGPYYDDHVGDIYDIAADRSP